MELKYNYVVFNWLMTRTSNIEDDYYAICLRDLENRDDIIVNHYPLQGYFILIRYLYKLCINRKWRFFTRLWYPYVFRNTFKDDKPICFVCIRYPHPHYFMYLRSNYPNCKIIIMSRDLIHTHMHEYNMYKKFKDKTYDYWMTYDEGESKKYGFKHFDEFESKIPIQISKDYPIADVFFTGRAKDRLPRLVEIYDKLTQDGIKCLFLIMGAPQKTQIQRDGIKYINKPIPYSEMLRMTVNSICLLDLNQSECDGYTSRILEAIMYNKKLITDNATILKTKYYNPHYVLYIKSAMDIDSTFVKDKIEVNYHYDNEFSPINRIARIDEMLVNECE